MNLCKLGWHTAETVETIYEDDEGNSAIYQRCKCCKKERIKETLATFGSIQKAIQLGIAVGIFNGVRKGFGQPEIEKEWTHVQSMCNDKRNKAA